MHQYHHALSVSFLLVQEIDFIETDEGLVEAAAYMPLVFLDGYDTIDEASVSRFFGQTVEVSGDQ